MNKNILKWVIYGGLFLIPFVPLLVSSSLFFPFITTKTFAWRIIVEIVFAAWILLAAIDPEYRPKRSTISLALLAFTIIIGLADAFGVAPVKSFWSNFERMEGFITILHLGLFYIVVSSFFKELDWKRWWNTSLVASLIVVFYCTLQLFGSVAIHQGGSRVDGSFGNSAYLAVYLLFHIFIALLFLVRTRRGSLLRWSYGILILMQMVILYYTATRGAILGLLGGLLIVALFNLTNKTEKRIQKASISGIVLFFILIGGFFAFRHTQFFMKSPVLSRFSSISTAELKTEGRAFVWPMAIQGIKERPLLGWGQENFNYVFNEHYSPKMFALEPWFDRAHNIFLDWGVAGGILGLLSYISLYAVLLYMIWRKPSEYTHNSLTRIDRSILTGLVAGYFFHNLFVFDYLMSYILFVSLLAFVHVRTSGGLIKLKAGMSESNVLIYVMPVVLILLIPVLYFGNIRPIIANMKLINALEVIQTTSADKSTVLGSFTAAYNESRLGRPEVVEWISTSANDVLQSNITTEQKNAYYAYAKDVIEKQAAELSTDARYQLLTGSFLVTTGHPDEAISYLDRAHKLSPGKQAIIIEKGSALLAEKDVAGALASFKEAYDLAPEYQEADLVYLVGAIYAGDANLANQLVTTIPAEAVVKDDRVVSALYAAGRYSDLVNLLQSRLIVDSANPQVYISLSATYMKLGDSADAIAVLKTLGEKLPDYKSQADEYIKQIQSGTITQ